MKKCAKCGAVIIRQPKSNNVKYCKACREEAYKYTEYRTAWHKTRRDEIATKEVKGKIACVFCGKWYIKPISHAWQVHGVEEREYKEHAGLDHKKGIIPEEHKDVLREHVKENYALVVARNLLKGGLKSRFEKGGKDVGRYKRSKQTMERLSKQFKTK